MASKKTADLTRGAPLLAAMMGKLMGPDSPVGDARPLGAEGLRAAEDAAGVALSPSMHALFSFDVGWFARTYRWFDENQRLLARPAFEVIAEHAGPLAEAYEDLCARRFPGKALALDQGSDSMRLVYLGDPDEHGEYPVLFIDHDDLPTLGVEAAGFDLWLAKALGVKLPPGGVVELRAARKRILGQSEWRVDSPDRLPEPRSGPAPGSVMHAPVAAPPPARARKLSDKQLAKALCEHAEGGNAVRLATLLEDVKSRGLPRKLIDDALVAAACGGREGTLRLLLDAGASPNARDHYGAALARLVTSGHGVAAARILLDAGAEADSPSVNGTTVLFEAIERSSLELVRLLLERGANPDHGDEDGTRPLVHAAREVSDPDLIDALLDGGASLQPGKKQPPALHEAIARGALDVARRLLARGADPNARAPHLKTTALHVAYDRRDDAFAGELVRAGADRSLADERGISFPEIYGPQGEDIRRFEVQYAPGDGEQTLTVSARVAVLNAAIMAHPSLTWLDAEYWVRFVEHGLAAGSAFDPFASHARVQRAFDKRKLRTGIREVSFELAVTGVAPEFLRLLARKCFGSVVALTDAGVGAAVRPISLSIRGSHGGASLLEGERFRAWLDDDSLQLGAFPGEPPCSFRVERSPKASVLVVPAGQPTPEGSASILTALNHWISMADAWPPPLPFLTLMPDFKELHRYYLSASVATKAERTALTIPAAPAEAALRNAMRVLHTKIPLREVVLTLP